MVDEEVVMQQDQTIQRKKEDGIKAVDQTIRTMAQFLTTEHAALQNARNAMVVESTSPHNPPFDDFRLPLLFLHFR